MAEATQNNQEQQAITVVDEKDLEALRRLKQHVADLAHEAREQKRSYLLQEYTNIISRLNPEIKRIEDRFERESLAYLRKEQKRLSKAMKQQRKAKQPQAGQGDTSTDQQSA